jgi:hypothetical protein
MTFQNIATVLGPNILRSRSESASIMVHNAGAVNTVALELVKNADKIFAQLQNWSTRNTAIPPEGQCLCIGRAAYNYTAQYGEVLTGVDPMYLELSFFADDFLLVWSNSTSLQQQSADSSDEDPEQQAGWWIAERLGAGKRQLGIVPSNYMEIIWKATAAPVESPRLEVGLKPTLRMAPKQLVIESSSSSSSSATACDDGVSLISALSAGPSGSREQKSLAAGNMPQVRKVDASTNSNQLPPTIEQSVQTPEDPAELENRSLRIRVRELERQIAFLQNRIMPELTTSGAQTEPEIILANCPRPPPPIMAPPPPALTIRTSTVDLASGGSTSPIPSPTGPQQPQPLSASSRSGRRMPPPPPPPGSANAFPERSNLLYVEELLAKLDNKKTAASTTGSGMLTPPAPSDAVEYPSPLPRQGRAKSGYNNRHSIAGPIMTLSSSFHDRRDAQLIEDPPKINFPAPPLTPPLTTLN